jgi:hypothetical protein
MGVDLIAGEYVLGYSGSRITRSVCE